MLVAPLFASVPSNNSLGGLRLCLEVGRAAAEILCPSLRHDPVLIILGFRTVAAMYAWKLSVVPPSLCHEAPLHVLRLL